MRMFRIIVALSVLSVLFACATGSSIVTGKARPAISPSEVKIYLDPPSQYETIGIVESSCEVGFSTQAAQDKAINELKDQAAKIGANGVILLDTTEEWVELDKWASQLKKAKGHAIFVIQE